MVSKNYPDSTRGKTNAPSDELVEEVVDPAAETHHQNVVTSHLLIKPTHSTQPLDKEVVLRRIRQRKRVNKLRAALESFFLPFSQKPNNNDKACLPETDKRWVDDAFADL